MIAGASLLFILIALHQPFLGPPASVLLVIAMLLLVVDRDRPAGRGPLRFGADGRPGLAAAPARLDLLLGVRDQPRPVQQPVQELAGFIPVTHAISQLQDVMLFGEAPDVQGDDGPGAIAAVSILFGWCMLRRSMGARG